MLKQKSGITLIALIITIIVLLILAGVTINMVIGENGIINKSKTSVAKHENAQERENSVLASYENEINGYINGNRDYETEINTLKARIAELENINNYSAEEKVIGTWVNGKPLYQKTYIVTRARETNYSRHWVDIVNIQELNIEQAMIDYSHSYLNYTDGGYITVLNAKTEADCTTANISGVNYNGNYVGFAIGEGKIRMVCAGRYAVVANSDFGERYTICITIQYTKTTDPLPTT